MARDSTRGQMARCAVGVARQAREKAAVLAVMAGTAPPVAAAAPVVERLRQVADFHLRLAEAAEEHCIECAEVAPMRHLRAEHERLHEALARLDAAVGGTFVAIEALASEREREAAPTADDRTLN